MRLRSTLLALATGCAGSGDLAQVSDSGSARALTGVQFRDSAGVTIVESSAERLALRPYRMDSLPAIVITREAGDSSRPLTSANMATRLSDGSIALLAGGARGSIQVYNPDGTPRLGFGRIGDGPGEYRSVRSFFGDAHDSLYIADATGVISQYDREGNFGAAFRTQLLAGAERLIGMFPDHSTLLSSLGMPIPNGDVYVASLWYVRHDTGGAALDTVLGPIDVGGARVEGTNRPRLLSARPVAAVSDTSFVVGLGSAIELREYDTRGTLIRIHRVLADSIPIPAADVERERTEIVARAPEARREAERRIVDQIPAEPFYPAFYVQMFGDRSGRLWVQRFPRPGQTGRQWLLFGADGVLLGTLVTPTELVVREIGVDYLLAVTPPSMAGQELRLYRLSP